MQILYVLSDRKTEKISYYFILVILFCDYKVTEMSDPENYTSFPLCEFIVVYSLGVS